MSLFDSITYRIFRGVFSKSFIEVISGFKNLSSVYIVILVSILMVGWITVKQSQKVKNILFIIFTILGGEIFVDISNYIFKKSNSAIDIGSIYNSFPSKDVFIVSILFGIITYYILRQSYSKIIKTISMIILISICAFVGISDIYLKIQYASGVIVAYLFATLWIILCITILELWSIIPEVASKLED